MFAVALELVFVRTVRVGAGSVGSVPVASPCVMSLDVLAAAVVVGISHSALVIAGVVPGVEPGAPAGVSATMASLNSHGCRWNWFGVSACALGTTSSALGSAGHCSSPPAPECDAHSGTDIVTLTSASSVRSVGGSSLGNTSSWLCKLSRLPCFCWWW